MLFGIIAVPPCQANAIVRTLEHVTYDVRDCIKSILLYVAIIFVVVVVYWYKYRLQFALWIKEIDRNKEQADTNELYSPPLSATMMGIY